VPHINKDRLHREERLSMQLPCPLFVAWNSIDLMKSSMSFGLRPNQLQIAMKKFNFKNQFDL